MSKVLGHSLAWIIEHASYTSVHASRTPIMLIAQSVCVSMDYSGETVSEGQCVDAGQQESTVGMRISQTMQPVPVL